jgi:hypothetical protein
MTTKLLIDIILSIEMTYVLLRPHILAIYLAPASEVAGRHALPF